ncbi:MAG: phosphate signaling complex protein PhoU, partial [Armatimonadota bacterium]|nr:phosphate signaling complex protein PhoU [Armatimonadota bacterium]
MAEAAREAIREAVEALRTLDVARAARVVADDNRVDAMHLELEHRCTHLLALQQPMASDLRTIAAVFAITLDLERLADHAEGIAKSVARLAEMPRVPLLSEVPVMAAAVDEMIADAINAFLRGDVALAEAMAHKDDRVDRLRSQAFRTLLTTMLRDAHETPQALEMLLVTQNLERAAD